MIVKTRRKDKVERKDEVDTGKHTPIEKLGDNETEKNRQIRCAKKKKGLTLGDFGSTVRLLDDNVPAYARHVSKPRHDNGSNKEQTNLLAQA